MAGEAQQGRFKKSEEDRILSAGYQMGAMATLGAFGLDTRDARPATTLPYDPSWRSIAGQAGGEATKLRGMSESAQFRQPGGAPYQKRFSPSRVYSPLSVSGTPRFTYAPPSPQNVSWAAKDFARQAGGAYGDYAVYRGQRGVANQAMRDQARRVANARAMAAQAAKKIPVAAGTAAGADVALAAGMAGPLVSGPAQFLFGEGPGSYAETQQFAPQIAALARYKGGPLDVRDLSPDTIHTIASDPGMFTQMYESGYLSDNAAAEISRVRSEAELELGGDEIERLRALGMME